jgi:hypothetical protein
MLAMADSPQGSACAAGGCHSSIPDVNRSTRKDARTHRGARSLAASLDERYMAKQPFCVTDRPCKREPSDIPFARSSPNEITRFILHLKGGCDKESIYNPQSLIDLFEILHANRSRHSSPYLVTLLELSNRVSVSLEAGAVNRVDARKEARVPGFEGPIPNLQDLPKAGDHLRLGVDRCGGWGNRGLWDRRPGRWGTHGLAVTAGDEERGNGDHDQQGGRRCRDPDGAGGAARGGGRWGWIILELHGVPLGEGRMVEALQGAYNRQ